MSAVLRSDRARRVLARIRDGGRERDLEAKRQIAHVSEGGRSMSVLERAEFCRDAPIAVTEEVAGLLYVLARGCGGRVVEFGGSLGISAIHLAAALQDRGEGSLITTEIDPEKARVLTANLGEADLGAVVEVRVGDALETLQTLPGPVDMLFLDGWNELYLPVLRLLEPSLTPNALVVADLSVDDPGLEPYLEHVRDPRSRWLSVTMPLDAGVEISLCAA